MTRINTYKNFNPKKASLQMLTEMIDETNIDLKVGQEIEYKKANYNYTKPPSVQKDNVGTKSIIGIDKEDNKVYFEDGQGNSFSKDIDSVSLDHDNRTATVNEPEGIDIEESIKEKMSDLNQSKLKNVLDYASFIENEKIK